VESRKRKGFRLDLGDPLDGEFAAFAATYRVKGRTELIRQILTDFMEKELDRNRERRRRYYHNLRTGRRNRWDQID
jgi:hypothetical protein